MKFKAAKTAWLLSVLFLFVYGGTNWLATLRHHVPSAEMSWDHLIPFLPWTIIPYMSIDLFFIAAPFLCRSNRDLRILTRRIAAAILIAGLCFLIFPLRFSFPRPHVDGWLGLIFNNFRNIDQPFNEFPSLHIALCVILAVHYAKHTKGFLRIMLLSWFALIAISAVTTYQHHLIDVAGGFALAIICLHFFQDAPLRQPFTRNYRVGFYYALGSLFLAASTFTAIPWTLLFLWPATTLALVALAYVWLGPGVFRKTRGQFPLTTWLLLGPLLPGQKLSLLWYARNSDPWNRLTDNLWIGRRLNNSQSQDLVRAGVTAVLDLTAEFPEPRLLRNLNYLQIPILDLTAPTPAQLKQALDWLKDQTAIGVTFIHCKAGYSRTGAIAGAFLLATDQADSADQAITMLRHARPPIILRPEAIKLLQLFQASPAIGAIPSPILQET